MYYRGGQLIGARLHNTPHYVQKWMRCAIANLRYQIFFGRYVSGSGAAGDQPSELDSWTVGYEYPTCIGRRNP